MDGAQLANSSHIRASTNSSNASSASSPQPESKADLQASSQSGLSSGHIAPVSPFKPGHSVFPLPPASMGYHGSIVGAYAGYPSQFVPGLDPTKSTLGLGLPGKHPSSSPLTGASPPSLIQSLCRDPYCMTYPNTHHLGGSNCSTCVHDPSTLKTGFPLVYPSHHLHSLHSNALSSSTTPSLSHPLYTYGFMLPNEPMPHACNWVSVGGPCDKRFGTSEELLAHLRTHTALPGMVDSKLLPAYPSSVSSTASCHLHLPPPSSPGALPSSFSLRGSPGLGLARYHPYGKSHLAAPGLPMPSLPASSAYYSPYALYSQRLGSASALGYQWWQKGCRSPNTVGTNLDFLQMDFRLWGHMASNLMAVQECYTLASGSGTGASLAEDPAMYGLHRTNRLCWLKTQSLWDHYCSLFFSPVSRSWKSVFIFHTSAWYSTLGGFICCPKSIVLKYSTLKKKNDLSIIQLYLSYTLKIKILHHDEDGMWGFILGNSFNLLSLIAVVFLHFCSDSGGLHVHENDLEKCHYYFYL